MRGGFTDSTRKLPEIAVAALDALALDDICRALEAGELQVTSTAAVRSAVAQGRPGIEDLVRRLQELWASSLPELPSRALAVATRACAEAAQLERLRATRTQVVWTGPKVEGSFLRATREVLRELIRGARRRLLVIGYWLAARDDGEGIIAELIELVGDAMDRGVAVTMVLDERQRSDGTDNRRVLLDLWPRKTDLPRLLTWRRPPDDRHLKLHAKAVIADGGDALATSANLTWYAIDRNIEIGVRITGRPAADIARHFELLAMRGVLEAYGVAGRP